MSAKSSHKKHMVYAIIMPNIKNFKYNKTCPQNILISNTKSVRTKHSRADGCVTSDDACSMFLGRVLAVHTFPDLSTTIVSVSLYALQLMQDSNVPTLSML